MEYILARELELEKKLQGIEERKKTLARSSGFVKLSKIQTPEDLGSVAIERNAKAQERNTKFLQDLDIEAGKLHTRRLCPIYERLAEQKAKFLRDVQNLRQHPQQQ